MLSGDRKTNTLVHVDVARRALKLALRCARRKHNENLTYPGLVGERQDADDEFSGEDDAEDEAVLKIQGRHVTNKNASRCETALAPTVLGGLKLQA